MSAKADLEKGTLPFAVMQQAQDVGMWSKSRVSMFLRLPAQGQREHGESLVESSTYVTIYKRGVTQNCGRYPCQVEDIQIHHAERSWE